MSSCQQENQNAQNKSSNSDNPNQASTPINALTEDQKIYYATQGEEITSRSAQALGQKLMAALSDKGVNNALRYCNLNAIDLTDSLSKSMGVSIQRTSLNYRNISNQPHQQEEKILKDYMSQHAGGESLEPITAVTPDGDILYASPILVNMLCLKCHGKVGDDVKEDNYALVKSLYPYDKAVGYKAGDFRGMWVVKFPQ